MPTQTTAFADSKKHYEILDGLRGVAALMVVFFHVFEILAGGDPYKQIINHGYLAVDFFYALSGFVIGYAYDDRWSKMSLGSFFKRRLIRLHPMILVGMIIGAIGYYLSASPVLFPQISELPVWRLLLVMFLGFFLVPVSGSLEIRGWGEMFPLNGPAWTLLFEYIANLLYALVFRHLPNVILIILVILSGAALIHLGVAGPRGDVIGGWSLTGSEIRIGFIRLLYPFLAGLLLSRIINPGKVRWAFLWCSLLIIVVLSIPRLGGAEQKWINGLYDALTIILVFPLIVYLGASGEVKGKLATRLSRFLGQISYPIYITHYPLIYIYASWVVDNEVSATWALTGGFILVLASIAIAYVTLKWYDIPVRKWLARRFLFKK